ncbi:energy-converting hydrogenase Eha subunit C [Caballeronia udeis]|uniref:Energy-converting hydrogenase Eha subunit C n=2 Tax=Caballeronia udeis TaxID=1232866 RepID=A0ABW8MIJ6_9BURK
MSMRRFSINMPDVTSLVSIGLVLNLFLMRPTALGETYTPLGMALALPLVGLHLLHNFKKTRYSNSAIRWDIATLLSLLGLYWLYICPISIFFEKSQLDWVLKEFITSGIIVLAYGAFLMDVDANRKFFRTLCTVIALLGLSSVITVALSAILGGKESLFLFSIDVKGYTEATLHQQTSTGAVYFPFSMLYGDYVSGAVKLDRYCAFFREAGIYQGVACFCLAYEAFTRRSKVVMFGLAGGTICAFSSLGVALLAMTIGSIFLFSGTRVRAWRVVLTAAMIALVYPVSMYTPYIGLEDKAVTHGSSLSDRSMSIERGLEDVRRNPLGNGLYSSLGRNDGICLLAELGMIGLFGFICKVLLLSGFRLGPGRDWKKIAACAPLLITALVSQPIAGAPMMYVIGMVFVPRMIRRRFEAHDPMIGQRGFHESGNAFVPHAITNRPVECPLPGPRIGNA